MSFFAPAVLFSFVIFFSKVWHIFISRFLSYLYILIVAELRPAGACCLVLEAWRLWLNSLKNFSQLRTYAAGRCSRGRIKYQLKSLCLILFIIFIYYLQVPAFWQVLNINYNSALDCYLYCFILLFFF